MWWCESEGVVGGPREEEEEGRVGTRTHTHTTRTKKRTHACARTQATAPDATHAQHNNKQHTNLEVRGRLGHRLELGDRAAAGRAGGQAQERALRRVFHRLAREALRHQAAEAAVRGVLVQEVLHDGARDDVADVVRAAAHVFRKRDAFFWFVFWRGGACGCACGCVMRVCVMRVFCARQEGGRARESARARRARPTTPFIILLVLIITPQSLTRHDALLHVCKRGAAAVARVDRRVDLRGGVGGRGAGVCAWAEGGRGC